MRVSVVITCFNREQFIGRAIRSAISQGFPRSEYEVIVVDDGSTDHSPEVIRDFGDEIVAIFHDKNMGLPTARNSGIRRGRGRYVVHLDSDDYMSDNLIQIEEMFLAHNDAWGAVSCDYYLVDEMESHLGRHCGAEEPIACGIMFRKEYLIAIGLYDPSMRYCEDEELLERYAAKYKIGHVELPLYRYTRHATNLTNDHAAVAEYRRRLVLRRENRPTQ